MTLGPAEVENRYRERIQRETALLDRFARRDRLLSRVRLVLFLGAALAAVLGLWRIEAPEWRFIGLALALGTLFVLVVVLHAAVVRRLQRARGLAELAELGLARLLRNFAALPLPAGDAAPSAKAQDLDLLGPASLFHLACTAKTPSGRTTLARWLLEPANAETIQARQEAVRELAQRFDLRLDLELEGRPLGALPADGRAAADFAETHPDGLPQAVCRLTPWLTCLCPLLLVGDLIGLLPSGPWLLLAAIHLAGTGLLASRLRAIFGRAEALRASLTPLSALLGRIAPERFESPLLRELSEHFDEAEQVLYQLERIVGFIEVRGAPILYLPLQALGLWDLHWAMALERLRSRYGSQVRIWLDRLGEIEALASLAGLCHDNPGWTFPEISAAKASAPGGEADANPAIEAFSLGHPLLKPSQMVENDVALGPPGSFLLVTGSNMSGKSTLLRAVGVNVALALAGGPVCARSMRLPILDLETSFRVRDSLAQGVSTFMAELQKLRAVVDAAREAHSQGRPCCFLLDEILLGTNTVERHLAVQQVLTRLLELGAIGAIATHDLSLAEVPALSEACRPVHFSEHFTADDRMEFDYVMRPGLATTQNALRLLRLVGL